MTSPAQLEANRQNAQHSTGPATAADNPQIDAALAQAQTFRDDGKTFGLITLYESRINRNLQRNLDRLRQLQSERRAARARALGEFLEQKEFDKLRGKTAAAESTETGGHPGEMSQAGSGFVFSSREIDLALFRRRRSNLLGAANQLASGRPNRRFEDAA